MLDTVMMELTRLYLEKGALTPSSVVKAARNPQSPLHGLIEWDADQGLLEYQLIQARRILRVYPVQVTEGTGPERMVHVSTEGGGEGEYHPISVVVARPTWFEQARMELETRLVASQRALDELLRAASGNAQMDRQLFDEASTHIGLAVNAVRGFNSGMRQKESR